MGSLVANVDLGFRVQGVSGYLQGIRKDSWGFMARVGWCFVFGNKRFHLHGHSGLGFCESFGLWARVWDEG